MRFISFRTQRPQASGRKAENVFKPIFLSLLIFVDDAENLALPLVETLGKSERRKEKFIIILHPSSVNILLYFLSFISSNERLYVYMHVLKTDYNVSEIVMSLKIVGYV